MKLEAKPLSFQMAKQFIAEKHRHHKPPQGWKFGIGAFRNSECVGVVCVGRPVSRMLDDGDTCEVTRLCSDGSKNVCSFLYGQARRAAFAMGYKKIITYILDEEPGTSLKAAGWKFEREAGGGSWSREKRKRDDKAPLNKKQLWSSVA